MELLTFIENPSPNLINFRLLDVLCDSCYTCFYYNFGDLFFFSADDNPIFGGELTN